MNTTTLNTLGRGIAAPAAGKTLALAIAALALGTTASEVSAQTDLQLPFMYGAQTTTASPAALQNHKVTVSLPGVSFGGASPFAVDEVGEVRNGTLYLDGERFTAAVANAERDPSFDARVETLGFTYGTGKWQAGFSHAIRMDGSAGVAPGLSQLAVYGNGPYVGEVLEVAPRLDFQAYQEFAMHGAYSLTDEWVFGARFKYLSGAGALRAREASLEVYTDPDLYQATVTSDATLRSAGVPVTFDGLGVDVGAVEGLTGAGSGFGFDLGVTYAPNEQLTLGLSARDIGSIHWNGEDARAHTSRGTYTFEGYRGDLFAEGGTTDFDLAGVLDSVVAAVEFESEAAPFRTSLPTTVQATGEYAVSDRTTLNATVVAAQAQAWRSGFGVGLTQGFGRFGQVGILGGARTGGAFVGANLTVDVYGAQLYVASDNLLTVFNLAGGRDAHVRAGLNLAFGAIQKRRTVKGFYDTKVEGINK